MNDTIKSLIYTLVLIFSTFQLTSCSKDSDLLAEYVLNEDLLEFNNLVVNDNFSITYGQSAVLDVLRNDQFADLNNVTIVNTTTPQNGIVIINEDNTLTYTPSQDNSDSQEETSEESQDNLDTQEESSEESQDNSENQEGTTDTFDYTTEETNEDGEVTTEDGTVTVNTSESKIPTTGANVYYVTTEGKDSNNGESEATSWNIDHAFKVAKSGDFIHIKAGNYGSKNLVVRNSGTSANPIRFIGYTNNPGDVISNNGSTFSYGDSLDPTKMPLIKSSSKGQSGIGLHVWRNYIEIENFQIQLYERGIDANGETQIFKNIITYETGPQNINTPSGQGVVIRGNNTKLENSFDYNSVSQGITLNGATNAKITYCKVYNDNEINPGGYYILLGGGTKNAIVENCIIYRKSGLFHGGHGYVCKDVATNNIIRKSVAYNTGIEANFRDVHDNLWEDIEIYGNWPQPEAGDSSASIKLANGAHHNVFRNILLKDVKRAFVFEDWDDGFTGNGGDMAEGSHDNLFESIVVNNTSRLFYMAPGTSENTFSKNNTWNNCSFENIEITFALLTKNSNNLVKNSLFDNVEKWAVGNFDPNFDFQNCTMANTDFSIPGILKD
jgi:hypothetical protein